VAAGPAVDSATLVHVFRQTGGSLGGGREPGIGGARRCPSRADRDTSGIPCRTL